MQFQRSPWLNDPRSTGFSHDKLFGTVSNFPAEGLKRPLRPRENQGNTLRFTFITPGSFLLMKSHSYFEYDKDMFPFTITTGLRAFD